MSEEIQSKKKKKKGKFIIEKKKSYRNQHNLHGEKSYCFDNIFNDYVLKKFNLNIESELQLCSICCLPMHIAGIGKCLDVMCWKCLLRMRVLQNENKCPFCKMELDAVYIFMYSKANLKLIMDNVSRLNSIQNSDKNTDNCVETRSFFDIKNYDKSLVETEHSFFVSSYKIKQIVNALLSFVCWHPDCSTEYLKCNDSIRIYVDKFEWENHLISVHGFQPCPSCLIDRVVFIHEQWFYTRDELKKHISEGSRNSLIVTMPHIYCKICSKYVFDIDVYCSHIVREHITCYICDASHKEYNQPSVPPCFDCFHTLFSHYKQHHFWCNICECTAFATEIDLSYHVNEKHPESKKKILFNKSLSPSYSTNSNLKRKYNKNSNPSIVYSSTCPPQLGNVYNMNSAIQEEEAHAESHKIGSKTNLSFKILIDYKDKLSNLTLSPRGLMSRVDLKYVYNYFSRYREKTKERPPGIMSNEDIELCSYCDTVISRIPELKAHVNEVMCAEINTTNVAVLYAIIVTHISDILVMEKSEPPCMTEWKKRNELKSYTSLGLLCFILNYYDPAFDCDRIISCLSTMINSESSTSSQLCLNDISHSNPNKTISTSNKVSQSCEEHCAKDKDTEKNHSVLGAFDNQIDVNLNLTSNINQPPIYPFLVQTPLFLDSNIPFLMALRIVINIWYTEYIKKSYNDENVSLSTNNIKTYINLSEDLMEKIKTYSRVDILFLNNLTHDLGEAVRIKNLDEILSLRAIYHLTNRGEISIETKQKEWSLACYKVFLKLERKELDLLNKYINYSLDVLPSIVVNEEFPEMLSQSDLNKAKRIPNIDLACISNFKQMTKWSSSSKVSTQKSICLYYLVQVQCSITDKYETNSKVKVR